jgi:hypothetical protein
MDNCSSSSRPAAPLPVLPQERAAAGSAALYTKDTATHEAQKNKNRSSSSSSMADLFHSCLKTATAERAEPPIDQTARISCTNSSSSSMPHLLKCSFREQLQQAVQGCPFLGLAPGQLHWNVTSHAHTVTGSSQICMML